VMGIITCSKSLSESPGTRQILLHTWVAGL
jgi:hypothetical protein